MLLSDGSCTWRPIQLEAHAERWSHTLRSLGVDRGERVAVACHNQLELVALYQGCWQADRLLVPLPHFFTESQMMHALNVARCDTLYTDMPQRFTSQAEFELQWKPHRCHVQGWSCFIRQQPLRLELPSAVRRITFTSGTTGTPKGVCLDTETLESTAVALHNALSDSVGMDEDDVHLCLLPFPVLLQEMVGWHVPRLSRAHVVLLEELPTRPQQFVEVLETHSPTQLVLNPAQLQVLVRAIELSPPCADSLRYVAVGSAPVPLQLLRWAHAHDLPVFEGYGLSEAGSVVTLNTPNCTRMGSCGRALEHVQLRVDDSQQVWVSGSLAQGYLTEGGFTPLAEEHPTGDLGHIDDEGFLHFVGRADELFVTSEGRNVSPEWVERTLQEEPAISVAFVYGRDRPQPCAVIASAASHEEIAAAVSRANQRLPRYAHVGNWTTLAAPLTPENETLSRTGKPQRKRIYEIHEAALCDPPTAAR